MRYLYTLSDTQNGKIVESKLHSEIDQSSISVLLDGVGLDGINIFIDFPSSLSVDDKLTLDGLIEYHDGIEEPKLSDPDEVIIVKQSELPAFASKVLNDGRSLFERAIGDNLELQLDAGETKICEFTVPYAQCKIDAVEVINGQVGDKVDFTVHDSINGDYTGFIDYQLNQFGFGVNVAEGFYRKYSKYDADLYIGMVIKLSYTNSGSSPHTVYFNLDLHEVK